MRAPEAELFKDKIEVSLDGKQVFYLFFGGAVIACLVFVMGVLVGRKVEARAHVDRSAHGASALDPLAALDRLGSGQPGGQLSFADTLTGRASDHTAIGAAAENDGETNPLVANAADKAAADKAAADKAAADKAAAAKAAADKAAADKATADKIAAAKAIAEKAAAEKAAADKAQAGKAPAEVSDGVAKFTLQLSSFQEQGEAESFAAKLRSQGYSPKIVRADVPDKGVWFRVRIGGYPTYDDAVAAKAEFERAEQVIAYVTRIK